MAALKLQTFGTEENVATLSHLAKDDIFITHSHTDRMLKKHDDQIKWLTFSMHLIIKLISTSRHITMALLYYSI